MAPFSTYYGVGLVLPSVILSIIYLLSTVVSSLLPLISKRVNKDEGCVFRLPLVIRLMINAVFGAAEMKPIKQHVTSDDQENPRYFKMYIYEKRLKKNFSLVAILSVAFNVIGCSFVTLWTVLLFDESKTCNEVGFDCFSNRERVTDCGIFKNGTTVHINGTQYQLECYRIVFNYVEGLAAAGGITFFATVMVNILMLILIGIGSIKNVICRWVSAMIFCLLLILLPIAGILCNIYIIAPEESSFLNTFRLWVYFVSFYLSITASVLLLPDLMLDIEIPCLNIMELIVEDLQETDSDSDSDRESDYHLQ